MKHSDNLLNSGRTVKLSVAISTTVQKFKQQYIQCKEQHSVHCIGHILEEPAKNNVGMNKQGREIPLTGKMQEDLYDSPPLARDNM